MTRVVLLPWLVVVLLTPTPTSTDWTSECVSRYPASCRCTWSSGKRSADCSRSNMNGLPVLSSEIQILNMSHNKLTALGDNAFTNANLINVQKLHLKSCRITSIHDLAFNNLRILIEVDLSENEIEVVDPVVFSTNVRLRVIKLNNNKVHVVREFPVLEYVNTLDLSYNLITNFSFNTFVGLRNLKVLDISYNQFGNVDPDIFPRLSSLMLRGNNWVCDCELKPLRDYVIANKFYEPELKCAEPLNLYMSQWDGFEELSCKPEILRILANGKVVDSIVALESTLVLSCVVRGEPLPDVKWVKNGRVVQDALMSVLELERIVMLNLTVGRNDNEFVCVGSNSGGVVERNLTITVDDAGLSGFVVLKDGVDRDNGIIGFRGERGSLVVYLVIGVVFLSLVVGLVVGGVCVWKWGKVRERDGDTVVKSVIKDDGGTVGKVTDERGDMIVMTTGRGAGGGGTGGGGSVQFTAEQTIINPTSTPPRESTTPTSCIQQQQQPPPPPQYSSLRYGYGTLRSNTPTYTSPAPTSLRSTYSRASYTPVSQPPHHLHHHDYAYGYYDYDDSTAQSPATTQLTFRSKQQIHPGSHELVYDTVVYTGIQNPRVTQRGVVELPQQISSPDICDLIVPPPPPPPQQQHEYGVAPPPAEFCECERGAQQHEVVRNALVDKASCLQDFRSRKPLLKPHTSADDLLDTDRYDPMITPDLLINGSVDGGGEQDVYSHGKFPETNDSGSVYENYDLLYNKPLISGADSLRRYAFLRSNDGSKTPVHGSLGRPSSVCSEPRGGAGNERIRQGQPIYSSGTVVIPHGYVTLPRRSMREKHVVATPGSIKYDNLGPRSTADGCSNFSLNKCGVDNQSNQLHHHNPPLPPPPETGSQQVFPDSCLYDQLNASSPPQPDPTATPVKLQFDPIPEDPSNEMEEEDYENVEPPPATKKYRPVPPPKPKKKKQESIDVAVDSDGTEV